MKGKVSLFIVVGLLLIFAPPMLAQQDKGPSLWRLLGNTFQGAVPAASTTGDVNLALGKAVQQSTTDWGGDVRRAVDGNTDGNWGANSVSHTANQAQPWWQVDLGAVQRIRNIRIWNRTDCCGERLSKFFVLVSDAPFGLAEVNSVRNQPGVWNYYHDGVAGRTTEISVNRTGRYVRVQLSGTNYLQLAEVEVFGGAAYQGSSVGAPPVSIPPPGDTRLAQGLLPWQLSFKPSRQEGLLEELVVPNTRPEKILSRNVLEAGKDYIIEASGTWDDWGNTPHGVDAVWCFAEWRCGRQGEAWNQLRINGKGMTEIAGQAIPFNPQHIYRIPYPGQGKQAEFYSSDALTSWSDNLGAVTVRIYASGVAAEPGQETGRAYTGARPLISPGSTDLGGRWRGNDGGNYFLRQAGNQLWWLGQSGDGGGTWTNVFHGRVEGNQVYGSWADVPPGRTMNNGEMSLQIVAPNYLRAINRTGGFGGTEWTR